MKTDPLDKITRANLVLGAAVTAVAGLLWGVHGMLAAGVGAALACLNFAAITRLGRRAVRRVEGGGGGAGQGLPFALGMSVFVFSILLVGLGTRPSGNEAEA
jgi:hypothetical protein